jgi:two-component system sensor histidine kinase/response regulator
MEIEKYTKDLLNVVTDCLNEIVINDDLNKLMLVILEKLVKITNNKFGFIAEIMYDNNSKSYIRYQTVIDYLNINISNTSNTSNASNDYNYYPLFDLIYKEKNIIISNDMLNDSRIDQSKLSVQQLSVSKKMKNFIGVPLIYKDEVISFFVLANYSGTYDDKYIDYIRPFIPLINNIKINHKNRINLNYQKDIFLSHMSHEIRTPLNGIIGMGQFLIDTKLNDDQKKMVHIINKCSLQLLSFVNDLLDFTHITDGKINFEMKEFALDDCLKSAIELFQLEIEDKKITINIDFEKRMPNKIIHDRQRIQQIFVNIISNAIKFSKKEGIINVSIKVDKFLTNDQLLLKFMVEDDGCGISNTEMDKIKSKLKENDEQQSLTNYSMNFSIGLGLPISKFLINKMNGTFELDSVEKNGTVVVVKIPVKYNNIPKNKNNIKSNDQVLIISNNLEKRLLMVSSVINMGLLPIPVNTVEESNIYLTNVNTKFKLIIILINSYDDIINTLGTSDIGDQKYRIYKLIKNCQYKQPDGNIILFYNKERISCKDINPFYFIENKYDINFYNQQLELDIILKQFIINEKHNLLQKNSKIIGLSNLKILSIEDNYSNQKVLNKILSEIGIHEDNITCLCDGINFIENIENGNQYDIVFIDLKMPRLNGIDATKRIQNKNLKNNMFFVAITATVTDSTIKECFKVGMDAFIPKPIDIKDLINIVLTYVSNKEYCSDIQQVTSSITL